MGYTSEYAQSMLEKHGNKDKNLKKERRLRRKATKATLRGREQRAKRLTKRANKQLY